MKDPFAQVAETKEIVPVTGGLTDCDIYYNEIDINGHVGKYIVDGKVEVGRLRYQFRLAQDPVE